MSKLGKIGTSLLRLNGKIFYTVSSKDCFDNKAIVLINTPDFCLRYHYLITYT